MTDTHLLPLTDLQSSSLAELWLKILQKHGTSALGDSPMRGEILRIADMLYLSLPDPTHPAIAMAGEQLVELGIDEYEPLAAVQNGLTQWLNSALTPEQLNPVLTAFNLGAYRALHQRMIQTELHRQQLLQTQIDLRTQLSAFITRLQRELARPAQDRGELIAVTLGMLLREFTAEGAAHLIWQGNKWGVQFVQGSLPTKLFPLESESAPPPLLDRALYRSVDGQHQLVIPVPSAGENDLLVLVAEEWKISLPESALDQFALIGTTLASFVQANRYEERRPIIGGARTGPLPAPATRMQGYLIDETNRLSVLERAPNTPVSLDGDRAVLSLHAQNEIVGGLLVEADSGYEWDEDELELMNAVAEQMGQAWERARLNKENESRSRQLQAAAEVSRAASSLLQAEELMDKAVYEILRAFPAIYHAQVFLNDESNAHAVLRASTGEAGRQLLERRHSLPVGSQSVVGQATGTGRYALRNDTDSEAKVPWRPNPLLPETRAELAIPLRLGANVIGVLDVQSKVPDAFAPSDIPVLQTMADQLATAIENARAYQLQLETVDKLKELDGLKTTFLANMSHELRTPLNSIIGFSRLIIKGIDGPISDTQRVDLETIHSSGQHLLGLIDTLLDHAKIEAGKMELEIEEVELPLLIDTVMRVANGLAKDKPLRLLKEVPSDLPVMVGDPVRIRQILMNLLSNAIKFTDTGHVRLTVAQVGDEILFAVGDSGMGIPLDQQAHLFDAFYQVDGSPTRKVGGTGLGLAITKSFVDMHNGKIWLESRGVPGQGSTFYVLLPIDGPTVERQEAGEAPLVLAIDDELGMTLLYEKYLSAEGFRFASCNDPRRALDEAVALAPALILVDLRMPQINGLELLDSFRRNPVLRDVPIVVCSIEARERIEEAAFHAGANAVLQKPVSRQLLVRTAQQLTRFFPTGATASL